MSVDIVDILREPKMIKVCAPMVRYNCNLELWDNEFSTNKEDKPLVVQFAANNTDDFVSATEMVAGYCNGVDLNCGCPQRWAVKEGYGADLLKKPELIKDLVYQVRNRIPNPFTVSVKIRLLKDIRKTVELCRIIEKTGASFLTVHARTPEMRNEPIDLNSLKLVKDCVQFPVIANGDVKNLESAKYLFEESNCEAVMCARGILINPAVFTEHTVTPLSCIQDWLDITATIPTQFLCFHHHLVFMLEKLLSKKTRLYFNTLQDKAAVLEFLEDYYGLVPRIDPTLSEPIKCEYDISGIKHSDKCFVNEEDVLSNNFLGNIFNEA